MTQQLSPASKAVLNAALPVYDDEYLYVATMEKHAGMIAAAAIKAVADQVVPECSMPLFADDATHADWVARDDVRHDLLCIASELEHQ